MIVTSPPPVPDTYSYSVEGGTFSIESACTAAGTGNFGTTLWSTSNTLTTGIFLYNTQNGAETQNSGDYAMNGFYGTIINSNTASIQISSGEVVSIDSCESSTTTTTTSTTSSPTTTTTTSTTTGTTTSTTTTTTSPPPKPDCISYDLVNDTTNTLEYVYTDCSGTAFGTQSLGSLEEVTICAQDGSLGADSGITVINNGSCTK